MRNLLWLLVFVVYVSFLTSVSHGARLNLETTTNPAYTENVATIQHDDVRLTMEGNAAKSQTMFTEIYGWSWYTQSQINSFLAGKQDALVSGSNIKTINGVSLLGSGDLTVDGSGTTTALSIGTVTTTTVGITSENAADDVVIPPATTSAAGVMTSPQVTALENVVAKTATGEDGEYGISLNENTSTFAPASGYNSGYTIIDGIPFTYVNGALVQIATSAPVIFKSTAYTIGTDNPLECYGGTVHVTAAATITACDNLNSRMRFTVISDVAGVVSLDAQPDDRLIAYGLANPILDDGDKITSKSKVGDTAYCEYESASGLACWAFSPIDGVPWIDGGQ